MIFKTLLSVWEPNYWLNFVSHWTLSFCPLLSRNTVPHLRLHFEWEEIVSDLTVFHTRIRMEVQNFWELLKAQNAVRCFNTADILVSALLFRSFKPFLPLLQHESHCLGLVLISFIKCNEEHRYFLVVKSEIHCDVHPIGYFEGVKHMKSKRKITKFSRSLFQWAWVLQIFLFFFINVWWQLIKHDPGNEKKKHILHNVSLISLIVYSYTR